MTAFFLLAPAHLYTDNKTMLEIWAKDKLRHNADGYLGTGVAFLDSSMEMEKIMEKIEFPFFIATGDEDFACDYKAAQEFYDKTIKVDSENKKIKIYKGMKHNIKFEPGSDIIDWFRRFVKK